MPAYFLRTVVPGAVNIYRNGKVLPKTTQNDNGCLGNVPTRQDQPLRKCAWNTGARIQQSGPSAIWYADASKRLWDSEIASLKNLLPKANGNLDTKTKVKTHHKQESARTLASQLQQLRVHPRAPTSHPPRGHHSALARDRCLSCKELGSWERDCLSKGLCKFFINANGRPHMGSSQHWWRIFW